MDIKDVESLAELARIELTDKEKEEILKDMGGILAYVGQIEALNIDSSPNYMIKNVWREDEVADKEFSPDLLVGQFPDSQDGFLKVKKIL
jgi:aspartyl-tRNA(Asn)/glutamyl-tRNA(Gln) amidotransferase subunit C